MNNDWREYYDPEYVLMHHGIKGQRWGIRRFQNEDGTLTNKGRKRYGADLDINDRSRQNVAKIRLGEARRRLDVAKENSKNTNNNYRVAELKQRERSAKAAVNRSKKIDRGAKYAAKGETITGNKTKSMAAIGAANVGAHLLTKYLNKRMTELGNEGRLSPAHVAVAKKINDYGSLTMHAISMGYAVRQAQKNSDLRAYNASRWDGESGIKQIGSQEYRDVVNRRKAKG